MNDVTQAPASKPRKRGGPSTANRCETVSFYLLLNITDRLDDAYYLWNAGLSKETRISRAEFREMVLEKGLEQLECIRGGN